jgi:outer membrane biosynthesis protein TonB
MPITQIPFQDPVAPPEKPQPEQLGLYDTEDWETADSGQNAHAVPHLLIQLQDDLARSRRREAIWISIIVHLVLGIVLWNFNWIGKYMGWHTAVVVPLSSKDNNLTFLTLPSDLQKPTRRPNTNIASDKDRIATSRHPELDPKELRKSLVSPPPGAPGMSGLRAPQPAPPATTQNQPAAPQPQQQAPRPQFESNQTAQLQMPARPKNEFSKYEAMSPGQAIQEATQGAASRAGGGQQGGFGLNNPAHGRQYGGLEVLSDTQGVDFAPYLQRVLQEVREHWYELIPESAEMKKGKLALEFAIMKDGHVQGLMLRQTSGDAALDRPAWGSITGSDPFPPLPTEFTGPYLQLRFRFYYNPDKGEME